MRRRAVYLEDVAGALVCERAGDVVPRGGGGSEEREEREGAAEHHRSRGVCRRHRATSQSAQEPSFDCPC
jgi:hypothetical protein